MNKRLIKTIIQVIMDVGLIVYLGLSIYIICNDDNNSIIHDFTSSTEDGWEYVILYDHDSDSQFAMINGLTGHEKENLTIPGEINGIPVKVLEGNVFLEHELAKVTIPWQVEELSGPVFLFSDVKEIEFEVGSKLKKIDGIGALGAAGVVSLHLPDSVEFISNEAFSHASDLKEIYIGPNVKEIGDAAFYQTNICKIIVNETNKWFEVKDSMLIEKYKNRLITYDHDLSTLRIPEYIKEVDSKSIGDSLDSFDVDPRNSSFSSEYGILYNKDKTSLIRVPSNMKIDAFKFSDSDNLETIGRYAFWDALPEEKILLPKSVRYLDIYSFFAQDIYVPKDLFSAELQAFNGTLHYLGNDREFKNISITNAVPEDSLQYDIVFMED